MGNPKFSLGKFIVLSFQLKGKTIYCKYEWNNQGVIKATDFYFRDVMKQLWHCVKIPAQWSCQN